MAVVAVIGAQWGDEGKGKIVDMLAEKAKYVVRFSGGDNAGHTVVNPLGEFKLRLTPSGIFYPGTISVIGNGVVVNPRVLLEEMDHLNGRGVDTSRLYISDRAHLIMPYHILFDGLEEEARGGRAIGTTHKGIGPAYTDKVSRTGIRVGDLLDRELFREKLTAALDYKNRILTRVYDKDPLSLDDIYNEYCGYADRLVKHISDTTIMLAEAIQRHEPVLLEGAQGVLLDPDFGTYPYTTSSSPLAANACLGAGLGPGQLTHVLGIFKSFQTRVGTGPMPTELKDATGEAIRQRGQEFGTVTGRPRRCGWFDAVAARFSHRVNSYTSVAITRLDVLDALPRLKICVGYKLDKRTIDYFPAGIPALEKCRPVYEELPGWQQNTDGARRFEELPGPAQRYVARLEELIGCPASLISVGRSREQTIVRKSVF
ncbi:MAG TPA: adenylosuccinate synthase [Dehalococcoidales bacterium]|nr:MAG: adenylosuccinate synthase [Chloroflexi bacterium RBG_16_60_22]HJX12120.1 adenylosuccinate synthase [Dehalococcoidales bacterium]